MTLADCRRLALAALAAAGVCFGLGTKALAAGDVVISQVWGSPGTNMPNADYVELFNRSAIAVDMTGWSIQVAAGTGSSWAKLDLTAVIQPYSYYLVRVSNTGTGNAFIADAVFATASTNLSTSGKVGLRSNTNLFTGTCPVTDATQNGSIIDFLGYGTAANTNCREGTTNAPVGTSLAPGGALYRVASGCVDTDNNAADFVVDVPVPRNALSAPTGGCTTGACCNLTTGVCLPSLSTGCSGGDYRGDNTLCTPNPCPASGACCSGANGTTCSVLTASGCSGIGGFYQNDGTSCSPSPCTTRACCQTTGICCLLFSTLCSSQGHTPDPNNLTCVLTSNCIPVPTNDACSGAVPLTGGSPMSGNGFNATSNDGPALACMTGSPPQTTRGVWFTFTPSVTSTFTASTCGSLTDNGLEIFQVGNCADPATFTPIACDDNACPTGAASHCGITSSANAALITGVLLNTGTTYYLRLTTKAAAGTGGSDNYTILITDTGPAATGACCVALNGACYVHTQAGCTALVIGTYQGNGTTCVPSPCTGGPFVACCFSSGACQMRIASGCATTGGTSQGEGTVCLSTADICVKEACCNNTTGACTLRSVTRCTGAETGQGANTTCAPTSPCPAQGACCDPCTFACSTTIQTGCAEGTWHAATTCSPATICNTFAPAPANDAPCSAVTLVAGMSVTATIGSATTAGDGPASTCAATPGPGLWYQFMPAATSYHSVSTCGATFDTVLTILTGDCNTPASMTIVVCADAACPASTDDAVCGGDFPSSGAAHLPFVLMNAGTTYFVRVSPKLPTTVGGTFPVLVTALTAGACCSSSSSCTISEAEHCLGGNEFYVGNNTVCSPHPCPTTGACCNTCTYTCTLGFQSSCAPGSTFIPNITACSPNPCGAGPAPENDLPCDAVSLTVNVPVIGTVPSATSADDGPEATCRTSDSRSGVWYSFSPPSSGNYTISTCGATFNSVLAVFTGDCATPGFFTEVACDEDTCPGGEPVVCGTGSSSLAAAIIPSVTLSQGTTYYIRVQRSGFSDTAIGGTFPLVVRTTTAATGACCTSCGACTETTAGFCAVGYQGDGTVCSPNPCLALAVPNDQCANAIVIGPTFPFNDFRCNQLATPDGPAGSCDNPSPGVMDNSLWYVFAPAANGDLHVTIHPDSADKIFTLHATTDTCLIDATTEVQCDNGNPGIFLRSVVAGTTYYIMVGDQGFGNDGSFFSINVNFTPSTVRCCRGTTCLSVAAGSCTGTVAGSASLVVGSCGPGGALSTCCYADYDHSGTSTIDDLFIYINVWLGGSPYARIGGDAIAAPSIDDLFVFINLWLAGCT